MNPNFKEHKDILFEILLNKNYYSDLLMLIERLSKQGYTKKNIYNLLLCFHKEIQVDERTNRDEDAYNRLSDFLDEFTAWGNNFTILQNEPEI